MVAANFFAAKMSCVVENYYVLFFSLLAFVATGLNTKFLSNHYCESGHFRRIFNVFYFERLQKRRSTKADILKETFYNILRSV